MSDSNAPNGPAAGAGSPAEDPIVAKAKEAMGELFASTIAALGGEVQKVIGANSASSPAVGKALSVFTNDMIGLLGKRVTSSFPAGGSPPASGSPPGPKQGS